MGQEYSCFRAFAPARPPPLSHLAPFCVCLGLFERPSLTALFKGDLPPSPTLKAPDPGQLSSSALCQTTAVFQT